MKLLWTNLKHFTATSLILLCLALGLAVVFSIDIDYGDDRRAYKVGSEGPHVFFVGDQMFWGQDRLDFVERALAC